MPDEVTRAPGEVRSLVVSIVSHGHGEMVQRLLEQLAQLKDSVIARVVLTQNLPEPPPCGPGGAWPFALELVRNATPLGFGENHNRALAGAGEPFVCVLNPDVLLWEGKDPFAALVRAAGQPGVGCAYPEQVGMHGRLQDSERVWPTPLALWRRHVLRQADTRADWVSAACIVLPQEAWRGVQGFDVRYFMYCEDVDLCLRLRLAGWSLVRAPAVVEHVGQRASRRQWRPFVWHVRALLCLWRSPAYRMGRHLRGPRLEGRSRIGDS